MNAFFLWLEATRLSVWVRESTSVWGFPAILSAHAIGMGLAVGVNAALALRLLGVAPEVPPAELKRFVPVMWLGVWLNTASGLLLLIGYPTKAFTNPVFYLKLTLIGVGMWLFFVMGRKMFEPSADLPSVRPETIPQKPDASYVREPGPGRARWLGVASLACWAGAVTAGRLLAYTAHRILASW
jgi:hypothetical protein